MTTISEYKAFINAIVANAIVALQELVTKELGYTLPANASEIQVKESDSTKFEDLVKNFTHEGRKFIAEFSGFFAGDSDKDCDVEVERLVYTISPDLSEELKELHQKLIDEKLMNEQKFIVPHQEDDEEFCFYFNEKALLKIVEAFNPKGYRFSAFVSTAGQVEVEDLLFP